MTYGGASRCFIEDPPSHGVVNAVNLLFTGLALLFAGETAP